MVRTSTWCRLTIVGAALAAAALTLAACGTKNNPAPTAGQTSPPAGSFIGGAPSSSPSATHTSTTGGGNTGGGNTTPTFPKDAKSYGLAFLQALGQQDTNRLKLLAIQAAVLQVSDGFYNNLNSQWSYRSCGQDTNYPTDNNKIACVYDNAHGDEMTVGINKTQLGAPTAVYQALLDKTTYPADATSYVSELFAAFQNGNLNRVVRLSNTTVKGKLTCTLTDGGTTVETPTTIDGTYSSVTLRGASPATSGYYYTFKVLTMPGGKAGAVVNITASVCPS